MQPPPKEHITVNPTGEFLDDALKHAWFAARSWNQPEDNRQSAPAVLKEVEAAEQALASAKRRLLAHILD